jgi:AraC family transcriptional regulator, arabinose operon regulatory protein
MTIGQQSYALSPGFAVVLPPGSEPDATQDPANRLVVFALHFVVSGWGPDPALEPLLASDPVRVRELGVLESTVRTLVRAAGHPGRYGEVRAKLAFWQAVAHMAEERELRQRRTARSDERLQRVIAAVEESPAENWSVSRMTETAHLSRAQLTRVFAAATGFSPGKYVAHTRMNRARTLLNESEMTISEIAAGLGYGDVSYFSRQFRELSGISPGRFRSSRSANRRQPR